MDWRRTACWPAIPGVRVSPRYTPAAAVSRDARGLDVKSPVAALSAEALFVRPRAYLEAKRTEFSMAQPTEISAPQASRGMRWTGWTLSGLVILFLTMDCVMKLLDLDVVKRSTSQLGYPLYLVRPIGLIELACLVVYALPRTSVLGAILLTGLFGGAISSHLRLGDPLFTHV